MPSSRGKWKFAVDRGGTFTDVIGLDPNGSFHTLKLLSRSSSYHDASIEGIRRMLGLRGDEPLPGGRIEEIRFGTTVATNALLERRGGSVALITTKGFRDLLEIGYQDRPHLFTLCIEKPPPLYATVIEVDERIDSTGTVIRTLDRKQLSNDIAQLRESGIDAVAVVFMHSWINPEHELLCAGVLNERGIRNVVLSHTSVNLIKIVSRGQSTLMDAYLSTILAQYREKIRAFTGMIPVTFMQSNGRLQRPESFTGKNAIFSGPAGGVIAAAHIAGEVGAKGVIGFDMGGTSTDVSRFDGDFERTYEQVIAGIPLQAEMLNIVTVAAGGGSVLDFDGQRMTVGPASAGAYPGPACYGFGGPLTVTDANLLTGRILPAHFPQTFGPEGNAPLDSAVVEEQFRELADEINTAMGSDYSPRDIAIGFLRVANEKMAMAIKEISVSKGFDVREYALACFGGAGGQHACSLASLLDIETVIMHPLSSVLSAYGIGLSRPAWNIARTVLSPYTQEAHDMLSSVFEEMERQVFTAGVHQDSSWTVKRELDLRPQGAEASLTLAYGSYEETQEQFHDRYQRLFGFRPDATPLEVVQVRTEAHVTTEFFSRYTEGGERAVSVPEPVQYHALYAAEGLQQAPVYLQESLLQGSTVAGPAFIIDRNTTVIVDPGFRADIGETGIITITRQTGRKEQAAARRGTADPILLEVFHNIFMGIASEMGITLQHTAYSVNIKERRDFSCAIFDAAGDLVANAPHIPVHLGSMADTVKAVLDDRGNTMQPGDLYLSNNPYRGGSHLPDMTVVCPFFSDEGTLIFFSAVRGHHSDVGGTTPGSMPPSANHINEEGVLVDSLLIVREGVFREDALRQTLLNHAYPVRNVEERIFDCRAQIASCRKGVKELQLTIDKYGIGMVLDYMKFIQDNAEFSVKKALHRCLRNSNSFCSAFEDRLDDETVIRATVSINGGKNPPETVKAVIDFTGSGPQHRKDNLNAPASVVRSAVLYVLRSLIDSDIPLNSGCLKPVKIIIPRATVLSPNYPVPVSSGNVETSQRIVDVLLGAFGIAAASQGTMNNLLFEVEGESPYYETIAGGAGAVEGCAGASGVQVHMTNTRMTDPEILEFRHPGVRLERFSLRRGSGGTGRFPGGNGVIREVRFLKPAIVSIISERRRRAPFGLKGGEAGVSGVNLHRSGGKLVALGHREVLEVTNDESVIIETPGGGGYGSQERRDRC